MSNQPCNLIQGRAPARYDGKQCAAAECNGHARGFSRYCTLHARAYYRCRDPNGRTLRVRDVRDHRRLAAEYLQRHADHPAVIAAERLLASLLHDTSQPPAVRKQFDRLRTDGATPRDLLANYLAVEGLANAHPHATRSDSNFAFNAGNRVLRSSPVPSFIGSNGRRQPGRIPPRVAETVGATLRATLGVFASQFWQSVTKELTTSEAAAADLAQTLAINPFGSSPQ